MGDADQFGTIPTFGPKPLAGIAMTTRQYASETIREEGVNVHLAQLLRNRGISARAERRSREGIPDVRADLRSGDTVILECKWEESGSLLECQLDGRLAAFPEALGVVGVLYPARLRQEEDTQASLEAATDLRWWVHGSRGNSLPGPRVRTGSVAELADNLRILPLELEGVDRVAAAAGAIGYALEQAATQVTKHARISRRIADIIANTDQENDRAAALRIGCLVLFNALAFQDRLAAANEDVPTVSETLGKGIPGAATGMAGHLRQHRLCHSLQVGCGHSGSSWRRTRGSPKSCSWSSSEGDGRHPPVGRARSVRAVIPHPSN